MKHKLNLKRNNRKSIPVIFEGKEIHIFPGVAKKYGIKPGQTITASEEFRQLIAENVVISLAVIGCASRMN
jgi:propanediol utilization protein